ncbi:MAG: hypothetical protein O3A00_09605 [Planctomycetota bacterium]|nr:hypothetical protein [Planctomycetota bacterium]
MAPPRIAVIGSGAAAFGVLTALADQSSDCEITLFDIAEPIASVPGRQHVGGLDHEADSIAPDEARSYYDSIYRTIRERYPRKFPPPKTHFGEQIPRQPVGERLSIFKSQSLGGLTNFWGATMLPYTDREMETWPFEKESLYPGYDRISHAAGLAARNDGLDHYFPRSFATRPAIRPTAVLDRLSNVVNAHGGTANPSGEADTRWRFVSGVNRCAVETRENHTNSCTYCGECMHGCYRDSIFSSRPSVWRLLEAGEIAKFVKGRVVRIDAATKSVSVAMRQSSVITESGFDRVFLCAGCPATTEILMRSLGIPDGPVMHDNAVSVFPIVYFGRRPTGTPNREDYLSLCNLILGCLPPENDPTGRFAQVQVYPNFDYLWRYNAPTAVWPIMRPFMPWLRHHVFWGRLYLHSDHSQSYACRLKDDQFQLHENSRVDSRPLVKHILKRLRGVAGRQGFWIPPIPPVRQKTNSHYVATLPYGGSLVDIPATGEVASGVHVCDSTVFPESPAVSLTFTIMANAYRTAMEATRS